MDTITLNPNNAERVRIGAEKKARLLKKCRDLMAVGNFRPTSAEIAGKGGEYDIVNRFGSISVLYEEALDDATAARIAAKAMIDGVGEMSVSQMHRIARGFVFGRLST